MTDVPTPHDNGQHDQIRADIKGVRDDVAGIKKQLVELSSCVLALQHNNLRLLGAGSLLGGVAIFILSRAIGL